MTFPVSLVVAILALSQPAQAFRQQTQKRNVPALLDHALIQQNTMDMAPLQPGELKLGENVFRLGTYDILEGTVVAPHRTMEYDGQGDNFHWRSVGHLDIGDTVNVLKVEHIASPNPLRCMAYKSTHCKRVRAQIEQMPKGLIGWISLLDTSNNFRWAQSRADFCAIAIELVKPMSYCNVNSDKCAWSEQESCVAIELVKPEPKPVVKPEPPAPETPKTPENPETPETPDPAGGGKNPSDPSPETPEAPDTAGKDGKNSGLIGVLSLLAVLGVLAVLAVFAIRQRRLQS